MAEETTGEKPETQPITGREKPSPETGEAGGRSKESRISAGLAVDLCSWGYESGAMKRF